MQKDNSLFENNNKNGMPIEVGIENQSNEMIYQSVDSARETSTSSKEPEHDKDLRKEYDKDLRKEYGSTGAYEEYTATREEGLKSNTKQEVETKQSVTNMNVEGMPWFYEEPTAQEMLQRHATPELTGRETRKLILSSLLAALTIGGVFIGVIFLFLLFATKVWF